MHLQNFSLHVARALRGDCLAVFRASAEATGRPPREEQNIPELKPAMDISDSDDPDALIVPQVPT